MKLSKGNILVDNGEAVFSLSNYGEQLYGVNLKYLCNELKVIKYDRTEWGVDHFIVLKDYDTNNNKLTKKDLNLNIHLSEGNIKSNEVIFLTWSLPSKITCPHSTAECRKRCFAQKNETFQSVRDSRNRNLEETKKDTFINDMIQHFEYHLARKKTNDKKIFVRINKSGDFYSFDYFKKWVKIAQYFEENERILFQAYTKSMPIICKYISEIGFESIEEAQEIIEETNIHLVWSIWHDTPKEYTEMAELLGLQAFTAI